MPRTKSQIIDGSSKVTTRKRKRREPSPELDRAVFPYFANQQLDPNVFPSAFGLPIGSPKWTPAPKELEEYEDLKRSPSDDIDPFSDSEEDAIEGKVKKSGSKKTNPYKLLKVAGGRPAMAKKVTVDLDSDDEMIVSMKNAKYKEKEIAQRMKDEGRVNYNSKTIGTRYARIRKKQEEKNDEDLDAELTDWHDGDDEALEVAKKQADIMYEKLLANLEMKRWKLVAENLKSIKPVTSFSKNACKTRYEALTNGTAKPTPESLSDPDEKVRARIAARKAREQKIEEDIIRFRSELAVAVGYLAEFVTSENNDHYKVRSTGDFSVQKVQVTDSKIDAESKTKMARATEGK